MTPMARFLISRTNVMKRNNAFLDASSTLKIVPNIFLLGTVSCQNVTIILE